MAITAPARHPAAPRATPSCLSPGNTGADSGSGHGSRHLAAHLVHDASSLIVNFYSGEIDEEPGTDIVAGTWDGENCVGRVMLISGGSFSVTQLGQLAEQLRLVRAGDLDGDGTDEVYVAGDGGTIFGYDEGDGWRELAAYPEVNWGEGSRGVRVVWSAIRCCLPAPLKARSCAS